MAGRKRSDGPDRRQRAARGRRQLAVVDLAHDLDVGCGRREQPDAGDRIRGPFAGLDHAADADLRADQIASRQGAGVANVGDELVAAAGEGQGQAVADARGGLHSRGELDPARIEAPTGERVGIAERGLWQR